MAALDFVGGVGLKMLKLMISALVVTSATFPQLAIAQERFQGRVVLELMDDGRNARLVEDFVYHDPNNLDWKAPKNPVVNGASIPRLFWTVIGGPFEGKYRNASVIHDVACEKQTRPWRATHEAFYKASRHAGTSEKLAKIMYAAVFHFGPRWGPSTGVRTLQTKDDLKRMRMYIDSHPQISLKGIETLTSAELLRIHPVISPQMDDLPDD